MSNRTLIWLTPLICLLAAQAHADNTLVDERLITTPTGYVWFSQYKEADVNTLLATGYRLIDLKVNAAAVPVLFSGAAVSNSGAYYKQSQWFPALSADDVMTKANNLGMRAIIAASYFSSGQVKHAVVMVKDVGTAPAWWWSHGVSLTTLQSTATNHNARLIDVSNYYDQTGLVYSGLMIANGGAFARDTQLLPGYSVATLNSWLAANLDWSVEDLETTDGVSYLALVAKTPGSYNWTFTSVTDSQMADLAQRLSARFTNVMTRADGSGNPIYDVTLMENGMEIRGRTAVTLDSFYDAPITTLMRDFGITGMALAIVDKYGRLVYTRAYGYADAGNLVAATPSTAFRGGSMSKSITAMAMMRLVQDAPIVPSTGLPLTLQTKIFQDVIFPAYGISPPPASDITGTRNYNWLKEVTLTHVMHHTAGLVTSPNPMTDLGRIVSDWSLLTTPSCETILNYMLTKQIATILTHEPGTNYAYANFGPCVEQNVIDILSGETLPLYASTKLLTPLGIQSNEMFQASDYLSEQPSTQSVAYDPLFAPLVTANLYEAPVRGTLVPESYGGVPLQPGLSCGGWAFSPVAYARLAASMDGKRAPNVLNQTSFLSFYAVPSPMPTGPDSISNYYGNNFGVLNPTNTYSAGPSNSTLNHNGSVAGGGGWFMLDPSGVSWVVVLNSSQTVSRYAARDFTDNADDDIWSLFDVLNAAFNPGGATAGAQYPISQLPAPNGASPDPYDLFSTYGF